MRCRRCQTLDSIIPALLPAFFPPKWIGLGCELGSWPLRTPRPPTYRIWYTVCLVTVLLIFAVLVLGAIWRFRHGKRTGNRVRLTLGFWLKVLLAVGMVMLITRLEPGGPWTLLALGLLLGLGLLDARFKWSGSINLMRPGKSSREQ